jgi:hypothetical protein
MQSYLEYKKSNRSEYDNISNRIKSFSEREDIDNEEENIDDCEELEEKTLSKQKKFNLQNMPAGARNSS